MADHATHPLDLDLPRNLRDTLAALSGPVERGQVRQLERALVAHRRDVFRSIRGFVPDARRLEGLYALASGLLAACATLDAGGRALAAAAVKYFLLRADASPDLDSPDGFDDDAQVLEAAAARLGLAADPAPAPRQAGPV